MSTFQTSSSAHPVLPPITALAWANQSAHSHLPLSLSAHTSPPPATASSPPPISSEAILAEKRRRNAGASSRFRERRKQRERELQERVVYLERRVQGLEMALQQYEPEHPQLQAAGGGTGTKVTSSSTTALKPATSENQPSPLHSNSNNLSSRVSQLEALMTRFRQEKETDSEKLTSLEHENRYLKSLLEAKEAATAKE